MGKTWVVILIGWFNILCVNTIIASPRETFIDKATKSTVFITVYDSFEKPSYASGVLVRDYRSDTCVFLITNKHVLENKIKMRVETQVSLLQRTGLVDSVGYKSDTKFIISDILLLDKKGNVLWKTDTTSYLDIAAIEIKFPLYPFIFEGNRKKMIFKLDQVLLDTSNFIYDSEVREGAKIYFLGYPLKIHGKKLPNPMIRQGIIASKKGKELENLFPKDSVQDVYIIDAWALKGSSGSPVFLGGIQEGDVSLLPLIKFIGITSERVITYDSLNTNATIILPNSIGLKCNLPDTIFCRLKTLIPENTGLYFVILARKIRKVLAQFDKRWDNNQ